MKKIIFILITILISSCSTEIEYLEIDKDNNIISEDEIIGIWVKDGNAWDFKADKNFTYYDYDTLTVINSGTYYLLDGRIYFEDSITGITEVYYFKFIDNYPYAGSKSLKLTLFRDISVVTYWENVG